MRQLEHGSIRVAGTQLRDFLWLHDGTEAAPPAIMDGGEPYAEQAFVPVAERRRLTQDELACVRSEWHWPATSCISSFAIDERVVSEMRRVGNFDGPGSADFDAAGERLWKMLCESLPLSSLGPAQWLGVSQRPSGLRTSTFDSGEGLRIGLHLDSWDARELSERHLARTRLCVNLGQAERSLLFMPHDIRSVYAAVADAEDVHSANIGIVFCRRFPEAPVLELVVPPGHAYLAPTENMIHDGTSQPSSSPDVTIAWLGMIHYAARF